MSFSRRTLLQLAAGAAALPAASLHARAQDYPARPVRLLVGLPAGGTIDLITRITGQWLADRLGQAFAVENRPGAGGNLGAEALVNSTPDGYTLFMGTAANAVNATLFKELSYDFIRDTAPIAAVTRIPNILIVRSAFPVHSVAELIAKAKAGPLAIATPTSGTPPYMAAELFKMMAGIDAVIVPYRAEAQMVTDLLGGQVDVAFGGIAASIGQIKAGTVRLVAVGTAARLNEFPDVPTVGETVAGFEATGWCGLVAPAKTPPSIIERLHDVANAGLADAAMQRRYAELGVEAFPLSRAAFGAFIAAETEKWGKVVRAAGLKPE